MTRTHLDTGSWGGGSTRAEDWGLATLSMADSVGIEHTDGIVYSGGSCFDALDMWLTHYRSHADEPCEGTSDGNHFRQCPLDDDPSAECLNDCLDELQANAPIYCYVGASESDGADFGVWLSQDALNEAIRTGVPIPGTQDRNGAGSCINVEDGTIIDVNDHGNVSVYELTRGACLLSLV